MNDTISIGLVALGFGLGLRHGIDWDHIAAITDISSSVVNSSAADGAATSPQRRGEMRRAVGLATMYALGHAAMVVVLGLLALWAGEKLPEWLDPLMERVVGGTLLVLGVWVLYSLWRYGSAFKLQSRWMLVLSLGGKAWAALKRKLGLGHAADNHVHAAAQYGATTAFGVGVLHGIGAETGTQAVLLASMAGVTARSGAGSVLLISFVCGLLISNSLVTIGSVAGFISSLTRQKIYAALGGCVAVFSLFVGAFFVCGRGDALPDLQKVIDLL